MQARNEIMILQLKRIIIKYTKKCHRSSTSLYWIILDIEISKSTKKKWYFCVMKEVLKGIFLHVTSYWRISLIKYHATIETNCYKIQQKTSPFEWRHRILGIEYSVSKSVTVNLQRKWYSCVMEEVLKGIFPRVTSCWRISLKIVKKSEAKIRWK